MRAAARGLIEHYDADLALKCLRERECMDRVDYQTEPSRYRHWKLEFDGPVARLLADFDEDAGLRPGYKLKLNSYDLGVDIELYAPSTAYASSIRRCARWSS